MSRRGYDAARRGAGAPPLNPAARRRLRRLAALLRRTEAGHEGPELLLHDVARVLELLADPAHADRWDEIAIRYPSRALEDVPPPPRGDEG